MLLAAGLLGYRYWDPGGAYDVRGIDVSHHQGPIEWETVAAGGAAFVYIKATEGADWVDDRFDDNWRDAATTRILRGAYHFFTFCSPGADQAAHMIATVPDEPGMLPPAVDLEFAGNCATRPNVQDFRAELSVFLERIGDHFRMKPVVYTNADFYNAYLADDPPDVTWWIMSPVRQPWGEPDWTFWQYFPGYREGVDGRVDRNVFNGDMTDLRTLTERRR